jgi:hypothetical protein
VLSGTQEENKRTMWTLYVYDSEISDVCGDDNTIAAYVDEIVGASPDECSAKFADMFDNEDFHGSYLEPTVKFMVY